jgi:hypothetical protein
LGVVFAAFAEDVNNTLNKLTKTDKLNTIQYYVYDYQGRRVRAGRVLVKSRYGAAACLSSYPR